MMICIDLQHDSTQAQTDDCAHGMHASAKRSNAAEHAAEQDEKVSLYKLRTR